MIVRDVAFRPAHAMQIIILSSMIYLIAQSYSLAYLSLVDLIFPVIGLIGCWKFKPSEHKNTARSLRSDHLMLIVRDR